MLLILLIHLSSIWPVVVFAVEKPLEEEENKLVHKPDIDSLNNKSRELTFINPGKSLELAQNALKLSNHYKRGEAYAYRNIANINILNEVYNLGSQYLNQAENIFSEIKDTVGLADCYISYGHMYRGLQDVSNEIEYFKKAFELYSSRSFPDRQGVCALNLAEGYYSNRQFAESRNLVDLAVKLNTYAGNLQVLSACYKLLGELELKNENRELATNYFNKVLDLSLVLGENSQKIAIIESLVHLSELSEFKGNKSNQEIYLKKALNFAVENRLSKYTLSTYNELVLFYLNNNELKLAREYLIELNATSDSINKQRKQDQSELVSNLIQAYNLEQEKAILELTNQLQKKSLKIRNILLVVIALIALFILIMLVVLIQARKKVKQQNLELRSQNELIGRQKKELTELLANRDRLFSIIAHDLRNPFGSVLFVIELIENGLKTGVVDKIGEYVSMLSKTAASAYDLLEKLLLWAKNQKENITPEKTDLLLVSEVDESFKALQGLIQMKNIVLSNKVQSEIVVNADKNMLQTILRNIIQNAVKYTFNGGVIEVSAVNKNTMIEINIKDSGVGIEKSTVLSLFSIDEAKIRRGTSGEKGSGLGLVICKLFVEKNGGEIWFESELNKGTIVTFTLPALKGT